MKSSLKRALMALTLVAGLPLTAEAHRSWLLPSSTVLSGDDGWITVDAAVSNTLFHFEHFPLRLDGLVITAPDGSVQPAENAHTGRYRSTFDLHLTQKGTYKLAVATEMTFASYKLGDQVKRVRGTGKEPPAIPAEATNVEIRQSHRRIEAFATAGSPSDKVLAPTGVGLEMVPLTHPNDLFAGEEARFRLVLDGKPAAGIGVEVVPGGPRYQDKAADVQLKTDADGVFAVTWPEPGMYWLEASVTDDKGPMPGAKRISSYVATLEALPQ